MADEPLLRAFPAPQQSAGDDTVKQALAQRQQIESRRRPANEFQKIIEDKYGNKRTIWNDKVGGEAAYRQQTDAVDQALKEFDGGPIGAILKNSATAAGTAITQNQEKIGYHKEPLGMATYVAKEAAPWVGGIPLGMLETYGIRKGIGLGPGSSGAPRVGAVLGGLGLSGFEAGLAHRVDEHSKDPTLTPFMQDADEGLANMGYGAAGMNAVGSMISPFIGTGKVSEGGTNALAAPNSQNAIATPPTQQGATNALAANGAPAQVAGPQSGRADYQAIAKQLSGGSDFADRAQARDYVKKRIEANAAGTMKLSDAEKAAIRADPEFAGLMTAKNASYMRALNKLPVVGAIAGGTAALLGGSDEATAHQRPDESLTGYRFRRAGENALNALDTGSYYVPGIGEARMAADIGTAAGQAYANAPEESVTAPPYNPRSRDYSDYRAVVNEANASPMPQGSYPTVGNSLALQGQDGPFYRALDDFLGHFGGGQR
jgi:hypothetical protein